MAETDVTGIFSLIIQYGYVIVAVAALAEALPLLGWLVPGQAIIIIAGAAAALGHLDVWILILVTLPAGIAGDALGYYLGRYYGRSFLEKYGPRLRITPKHLDRSDALFVKYGPFALIVARFSFLTRAVGPILGGMSKMRARVFWPINILGAILWSVSYTLLGYFFGVSFLYLQSTVGKILAWTLLAIVALYMFYRVLKKYADQFTRDDLYIALLAGVSGALFGIVADQVQKHPVDNVLDVHRADLVDFFQPAAPLFGVVEALTSFYVLGGVSLALLVVLFVRRRWWEATLVGLGMGGIIVLVETLRPVFANALPAGTGDSFPSETAAFPVVFAGVLTYMVAMRSKRIHGPLLTALAGAAFSTIALFARLAQGVEHPSAVMAGLALGIAWLSVTVLIVEFRLKRDPRMPRSEGSPPGLTNEG